MNQTLFPKKNFDALIAAVAGFFVIWLYTRHGGIGVSPDSVVYMSVARNIHDHGLLMDFNDRPLVVFPAFYPAFLSLLIFITGNDPMAFAPVVNGLMFALVIYASGTIMEGFLNPSKWYKHLVLSCLVLSPCLLEVYSMLWSETLFLLILLFFFISLHYYFRSYSIEPLLLAAALAAFSCVTRYAGVTLIGTGGLLLLLDRRLLLKKKITHLFLFAFIGSSLLVINLARNNIFDGTSTGMRERSLTSLLTNLRYYGNVVCDWLPLPKDHIGIAISAGSVMLAAFVLLLWRHYRARRLYSFETIALSFFVLYSAFILLSATVSRYELINSRLLSPLFIPLLWGMSSWLVPLMKTGSPVKRISILVISVSLWIAFQHNQWRADRENYDGIKDAGIPGYTEDPWLHDSPIVDFLRVHPSLFKKGFNLYSNADDALYFFTGLRCDMIPHKVFRQEIDEFYIENNCYLVWFDDSENDELITKQDILSHKKMTALYRFSNGTIYVTAP